CMSPIPDCRLHVVNESARRAARRRTENYVASNLDTWAQPSRVADFRRCRLPCGDSGRFALRLQLGGTSTNDTGGQGTSNCRFFCELRLLETAQSDCAVRRRPFRLDLSNLCGTHRRSISLRAAAEWNHRALCVTLD